MKSAALIVDDEVQMRRLLRVVLESDGYKVHEAETGEQGHARGRYRRPEVILLDLGLPDFDGLKSSTPARMERDSVLILSVRDVTRTIEALDAGAEITSRNPSAPPNSSHGSGPQNAKRAHRTRTLFSPPVG